MARDSVLSLFRGLSFDAAHAANSWLAVVILQTQPSSNCCVAATSSAEGLTKRLNMPSSAGFWQVGTTQFMWMLPSFIEHHHSSTFHLPAALQSIKSCVLLELTERDSTVATNRS